MDELLDFLADHPTVDVRINASALPYDPVGGPDFRVRISMTETCTDERGYVTYDLVKRVSRWHLRSDILKKGIGRTLERMANDLKWEVPR